MILQHVLRTLPTLCLLFLVGCSGAGKANVSGNVKVDGQPLAEGTITFNAVDGNTPSAGGEIKNGSYSVAVFSGTQKIVISASKVTGSRPAYAGDPNSPQIKITEEILPKKYSDPAQTELTLEVKRGGNSKDFDLSTMP